MDLNTATQTQRGDEVNTPINPKKHITQTPENPHGYLLFDMRSICGFTNNQVIYYLTSGAIPLIDQPAFQKTMELRIKYLTGMVHQTENTEMMEMMMLTLWI
jgi:hypothetical protein